jgi:hypothetical protein
MVLQLMKKEQKAVTQPMNIRTIREKALNTPLKTQPVATPFWEETDGLVYLQDIPTDELLGLEPLKKAANGEVLYVGALLCRALVARDEQGHLQRIFEDTDRELVVKMGTGMLNPLFLEVQKFFGMTQNAVAQVKNG